MADYDESTYGERIADVYDHFFTTPANAEDAAEFLASIAGKRRLLELGIGTGRIALPLAARGIKISGIDASPKMVEKMREKPGGDAIPVSIGNFVDIKVPGQFSLIYVAFNTFFGGLLTQEDQVHASVASRVVSAMTACASWKPSSPISHASIAGSGPRRSISIARPR